MKNLKISIIVPFKNAAEYLPRCVESIRRQSGNIEAIFIDDGSEDNGAERLAKFSDRWPWGKNILLENEFLPGVGGARNTGLKYASGDWITFLDADDELLPDAWNKYTNMIDNANGAKILQANHLRHIVRTGATVRKYENPSGLYELPALPEMWAPVWNKLYKRDIIRNISFRDLRFGEDEMFNIECLEKAGSIRNTAVDLMQHNLENPESLSRTKGAADLRNLLAALVQEMSWAEAPEMKRAIYNTIVQHVETGWFQKIMCEE